MTEHITMEVLGSGCKNCDDLYDNVCKAILKLGRKDTIRIEKKKDVDYFIKMGVFTTPALVIDDKVVSTARVLSTEEIVALLQDMKVEA